MSRGPSFVVIALTFFPAVAAASEAQPDEPAPASHLLGPFRVGPVVGVGFPGGVSAGLTAKIADLVGVGVTGESIPSLSIPGMSGAAVARVGAEGYARLYPFRGAFFLGVGVGYEQLKGSAKHTVSAFDTTAPTEAAAYVHTVYVAPQLGWLWTWDCGLALGFDVGVELPIVTTSPLFEVSSYGLNMPIDGKGAVADAVRYASHRPIPVVNPLRVAFLF